MAGINERNADLDGKRAAIDLATSRPEDFSAKCWNIDNKLNNTNPEYAKAFMSSMNEELESRKLLPKVELNMLAQADNSALQPLQDPHKHIDTQDLVKAEDEYKSQGRNVEGNLVHGLIEHQQDIQNTHAERNFWGQNHGGIDMNRVNRWADQNKPDLYDAQNDARDTRPNPNFGPGGMDQNNVRKPVQSDNSTSTSDNSTSATDRPNPTPYDRSQDDQIRNLRTQLAQEKQERELHAKVEAGVIKDAHHTVIGGETLRDMACLALHKAGQVHMSEGMIKHEEAKIRLINGLPQGEQLTAGTSLMLRTREEVDHETARRMAAYDNKHHSSHAILNNFSIDSAHRSDGQHAPKPYSDSNNYTIDYADRSDANPIPRSYSYPNNYDYANRSDVQIPSSYSYPNNYDYTNRSDLPPLPRQYDDSSNYSIDYGYRYDNRPVPRRFNDSAWIEFDIRTRPHHKWTPPAPGFIN